MTRSLRRSIHVIIAATITVAPLHGQAARRALAIEDYYRVPTVDAATISRDGKWVTFSVQTHVEETNGNKTDHFVVPTDGSAPPRLDTSVVQQGRGAGGGRGGGGRGGRGGSVTLESPNGKWVASVRDLPPEKHPVTYASDFEKRHEERFKGVEFDWLDFHRDAAPFPLPNRVDPDLFPPEEIFLGANGQDAHQLTHLGLRPSGVEWNRDGSLLVFTADSQYRNERSYGRSDVWTVSTDGALHKLASGTDYDYRGARFSPDGKWILTTRASATDAVIAKKWDHGGPVDLVVIPAAGGAERNLTADWDYLPATPMWSPDGKYVYFTGGVGGTTHLFRVSPNGGAIEQVTKGERRLSSLTFDSAFSKISYIVNTDALPEVFVADVDGSHERQLTHVGDAFQNEVALSRAERVQYTSLDGTPIEGWLLVPYGYQRDHGPYPLIVSNHGGPHSAIEYGFNFKNQYFAANGYFVLEVNFRSSTGYGEKFLWGTWGAWGTKDGQDVMSGVDYVLSKWPIDRQRVATIGHSYGGFMTNWLITQYPDRFAAAASGAGIVNWTSDYGDADIPVTKEQEFFGPPWDPKAREIMIRQSPLTYADRVRTPTLFINGEIDQRVPFSENEQLYVALKKHGVPAKMIRYAGQPHSIAGNWNVVHRMLNERRWLDTYMKEQK